MVTGVFNWCYRLALKENILQFKSNSNWHVYMKLSPVQNEWWNWTALREIGRSSVYFDGRRESEPSNWFVPNLVCTVLYRIAQIIWANCHDNGLGTFAILSAERTVQFLASETFIKFTVPLLFGQSSFYRVNSLSNDLDSDLFDPSLNFDTRYLHKLLYNFYLISFQKLKALNHHIIIIFWNFWDFLRFGTFWELNLEHSTLIW